MVIASDIDGTLLDYDYAPGELPAVNHALIEQMRRRDNYIALITNQGGLAFGVMGAIRKDGRRYPRPADFLARLTYLAVALFHADFALDAVRVAIYHPKAPPDALLDVLSALGGVFGDLPLHVWGGEDYRKPSPKMLLSIPATCYYGDSDEDEQAAKAAGIEFVRVERFVK